MIALYKSRFDKNDVELVNSFIKTFRGHPLVVFFNEYFALDTHISSMSSNNLWNYNNGHIVVVGEDCVKLAKQCPVWKKCYVYDGDFSSIKESIDGKDS